LKPLISLVGLTKWNTSNVSFSGRASLRNSCKLAMFIFGQLLIISNYIEIDFTRFIQLYF